MGEFSSLKVDAQATYKKLQKDVVDMKEEKK